MNTFGVCRPVHPYCTFTPKAFVGITSILIGSLMKDMVMSANPQRTTKQGKNTSQHKLLKSLLKYLILFMSKASE